MFGDVYRGRRVLVTGHTGFKGSWLVCWLRRLGAEVMGFSLGPVSDPSHWALLQEPCASVMGDVRDAEAIGRAVRDCRPEIVLHLAAQPLVRLSYDTPAETFETNVMGTVNLLEAVRACDAARAVVVVTTDKCYENRGWTRGYTEDDALGGHDPYSASKGCAELVVSSYRRSFYGSGLGLATARAGNVIGGGDWAADRLVPDVVRAVASRRPIEVRKPDATRPWQHVLDPLAGYLLLGQRLLEGRAHAASAWNFGPDGGRPLAVREVLERFADHLPGLDVKLSPQSATHHEADQLQLDSAKAREQLGWRPVWDSAQAIARTAGWYAAFMDGGQIATDQDLDGYIEDARANRAGWATT